MTEQANEAGRDPQQERLEKVQSDIDEARHEAEEHGTISPADPPRTFADPDGDGETEPSPVPPPG